MFPNKLYKAFPCEEYAINFLEGSIRFSTLAYYKEIEDESRNDLTEGIGAVDRDGEVLSVDVQNQIIHSKPGIENLHVAANENERFICCFSNPSEGGIDALPTKFGEYYVIVNNPEALFRDIEEAIRSDSGLQQNPPCLEASQVRYDKGSYVGNISKREKIQMLGWMQKPEFYSEEQEYRFQFWFCFHELIESPSHRTIQTNRSLEYCEFFRR